MRPLAATLTKLRPLLAQAATAALADWQPDENGFDELLGGGGCCDQIAQSMSDVIAQAVPECEIAYGGQDGGDHAWIIVRTGDEVYGSTSRRTSTKMAAVTPGPRPPTSSSRRTSSSSRPGGRREKCTRSTAK